MAGESVAGSFGIISLPCFYSAAIAAVDLFS